MKFRSFISHDRSLDTGVIPLVNIIFLLLIFFMLVGRISPVDVLPVQPPASTTGVNADQRGTTLLLSADGRVAVGDLLIEEEFLLATVTRLLDVASESSLRVKADANVEAELLVRLMEILRLAGVKRILLLTTLPSPHISPGEPR